MIKPQRDRDQHIPPAKVLHALLASAQYGSRIDNLRDHLPDWRIGSWKSCFSHRNKCIRVLDSHGISSCSEFSGVLETEYPPRKRTRDTVGRSFEVSDNYVELSSWASVACLVSQESLCEAFGSLATCHEIFLAAEGNLSMQGPDSMQLDDGWIADYLVQYCRRTLPQQPGYSNNDWGRKLLSRTRQEASHDRLADRLVKPGWKDWN